MKIGRLKHTPGPWIACLNLPSCLIPGGHIIKADNVVKTPIALLDQGGGTKGKSLQLANAHLIAAAPQLLSALLLVQEELKPDPSGWVGMQIQEAIDQAEGRNDR